MALFQYKAMNVTGQVLRGRMEAVNLVDLELRLKRMELDFINGHPVQASRFATVDKIPRRELINFCFHMEQLARAHVPIVDGLRDLRDSLTHPRLREVIAGMIESIEGGRTLSQAMSEHPRIFSQVFCSLIQAGEESGNLIEVLKKLVESLKWEDELTSLIKRALTYPLILMGVVVIIAGIMMVYLVPEMATFFKHMGHTMPLQTRLLIGISDAIRNFWPLIIALLIGIPIGIKAWIEFNPAARYRFDSMKLKLPLVGPLLRMVALSRFASTFAMMYSSGVTIIDAIRYTEGVAGNAVIRDGLAQSRRLIGEGQSVTRAFQDVGLFPPLVMRMLHIGENTGALDVALTNVSYFYGRDVREAVERLQRAIEPLMTVFIGLLLLWVATSLLGPIYDVIIKLKT